MLDKPRICKMLFIITIICFIPLQITQAAESVDTLYSYPEDVPVIDGYLEPEIWSYSRELQIKLYGYYDLAAILILSIIAVYNEENGTISFGVTVPDDTIGNDTFIIIFKTNSASPLLIYDDIWTFGNNHDAKIFYSDLNVSVDGLTDATLSGGPFDTDVGGINNIQANGTHTGTQYTFEFTTPLDSGDTLGKDISLVKKDEIDFFVMYRDDGFTYSQIRTLDQDYDYCSLKIGKKGLLGPSTFFIFASLISTFIVFSFIARKRQKSLNK